MTTRYFITRPGVMRAAQWTGDNLAAMETFAAEHVSWALPFTDNLDGTLDVMYQPVMATGDWLTTYGVITPDVMVQYQEVPGLNYIFSVEEDPSL